MTKSYLNIGHRLPVIRSRRVFGSAVDGQFNSAAYRSGGKAGSDDADDDDDDDEPSGKEARLIVRQMQAKWRKELEERAVSKKDFDAIMKDLEIFTERDSKGNTKFSIEALREMMDEEKGIAKQLVNQGIELQELRSKMNSGEKDMSVRSQIKQYLEKNKDVITKIRGGSSSSLRDLPSFELALGTRAAVSPMTQTSVMPNGSLFISSYEVAPGIIGDRRPEPTFWDFIKKGKTNSELYIWVNKIPTEGSAAWLGPGEYKPPISFSFETETSHAKKIADSAKMPTELLEDIDGFESYVEQELRYKLMEKVNDTLMDNVETSKEPSGIKQLSVAYNTLTGVHTTNPNNWDAIKAAVTMLRVSRFRGPIVAFMNPVDVANAVMTKAQTQGQLFIPPATGATIVEDLNIPLGYVNVVAMDYYKLLIYKPFRIAWGWENDDFTKNLVTAISEMRLHQFHSANNDGFSIYDTLDNIITAIDEAA